jgi:SAM-dependent methyltransferase
MMDIHFGIDTEYPVAMHSNDHMHPRGAANDNSVNYRFNHKLLEVIKQHPISVLDLGCAGGGMVKSFLGMGHIAVGIEGSNYCKLLMKFEWATIPKNLFTADATKKFTVHPGDHHAYLFDVITGWEFFEHIEENDLGEVINNIHRHLKPGGLLICSITDKPSTNKGFSLHRTLRPYAWWSEFFQNNKFVHQEKLEKLFIGSWVRSVRFNFIFEYRTRKGIS